MFEDLLKLGFSDRETAVYLMLLRIGPSPVSALARRVDLKRVTAYTVLDSLLSKGLVTFEEVGKCRKYIPHDPECILYHLEQQKAELNVKMELARECIEKFKRTELCPSVKQGSIMSHKGEFQVKDVLDKHLDLRKPMKMIFLNYDLNGVTAQFLTKYFASVQKCTNALLLYVSESKLKKAKLQFPNAQCLLLEQMHLAPNVQLLIQDDHLFMFTMGTQELQMTQLKDRFYANFMRRVVFQVREEVLIS